MILKVYCFTAKKTAELIQFFVVPHCFHVKNVNINVHIDLKGNICIHYKHFVGIVVNSLINYDDKYICALLIHDDCIVI